MTRNKLEQLVDRCISGNISESEMVEHLDYDAEQQTLEGKYIYLENIALRYFCINLRSHFSQGMGFRELWDLLLLKQILNGEKSCFDSFTLRMPSDSGIGYLPVKAKWLLDLVYDNEWAVLRELIVQYRETHSIADHVQEKYLQMAEDETFEVKTIIDLAKKIIYHNISRTWFKKNTKGVERFYPGLKYGQEVDPLDYTNKLLKMIDCCEGKSFFIVAVNYLNGQPNIFIVP